MPITLRAYRRFPVPCFAMYHGDFSLSCRWARFRVVGHDSRANGPLR
jgi:hypothetical protein